MRGTGADEKSLGGFVGSELSIAEIAKTNKQKSWKNPDNPPSRHELRSKSSPQNRWISAEFWSLLYSFSARLLSLVGQQLWKCPGSSWTSVLG